MKSLKLPQKKKGMLLYQNAQFLNSKVRSNFGMLKK